ncbi:MAG: MBL fold metallo-hydrolase [Crocinitomicaceae bacterium]|nr:MBL fold metallo-hydrolase [Crocinitomicaceae bacterium]
MDISTSNFRITFLGGAGTVTGSKTLIETQSQKVLVDCGLFQGIKQLRHLNRASLTIDASSIDAIILTHAHLDHCGYLPVLVKNGFKGSVHCTAPTAELTAIILKDSAKIQEEDALRANKYHYSRHKEAKPLYTQADVRKSLELIVEHDYNEWIILDNSIKFELLNNGHIIGSAFVNMKVHDKSVVFSGDIGRLNPMLLYPPKKIKKADYLIMESTYGDRNHSPENVKQELRKVIHDTYEKRGILMIPSFAVERTQELLYLIYQLRAEDDLPPMQVYLDSPMGINTTQVYDRYHELQNISNFEINRIYDEVRFISDPVESKEICLDTKPKIVLAGSGMIEGGRILHYLNNHMSSKKNTLLFVGYQGEGTRGRAILKGSDEIKFFGQYKPVNCEIRSISSLSAHADQSEIITWLKNLNAEPKKIFLNHGEQHQSDALRVRVDYELGWNCEIPSINQEYLLD